MNYQWKRLATALVFGVALVATGSEVSISADRPRSLTSGDAQPTPEPTTLVLFGSALAGLVGYRALKKRGERK